MGIKRNYCAIEGNRIHGDTEGQSFLPVSSNDSKGIERIKKELRIALGRKSKQRIAINPHCRRVVKEAKDGD